MQLAATCRMRPSSSDRSTVPFDCANSTLRNLASKNGLSSARMNLCGVRELLKHTSTPAARRWLSTYVACVRRVIQ
jgi:hypothetical protein